ncbi:MAG: hypothetical protein ABIH71_03225 [Candidatus Omnitrophota bacterium]|nr:hypothetical protein [Candidatus Omnitrophota bacterium]
MSLATKKLIKVWGKGISVIIGLVMVLAVVSQVWAWDSMNFEPFEPMVIAQAEIPKDISLIATKVRGYIIQLDGIQDPGTAHRQDAFMYLVGLGIKAVPELEEVVDDLSVNSDARKHAAYALGEIGRNKKLSLKEVLGIRDFLENVITEYNDKKSGSGYDWWHAVESYRGLVRLYKNKNFRNNEEFKKNIKSMPEKVKGYEDYCDRDLEEEIKKADLVNSLSGWGGGSTSIGDRLHLDFLHTRTVN